jgi:hypothetical protein
LPGTPRGPENRNTGGNTGNRNMSL